MASDNQWEIPYGEHGDSFIVKANRAEYYLKQSLNLLEKIKNTIPQTPASETKQLIDNFLNQFKKS